MALDLNITYTDIKMMLLQLHALDDKATEIDILVNEYTDYASAELCAIGLQTSEGYNEVTPTLNARVWNRVRQAVKFLVAADIYEAFTHEPSPISRSRREEATFIFDDLRMKPDAYIDPSFYDPTKHRGTWSFDVTAADSSNAIYPNQKSNVHLDWANVTDY